MVAEFPANSHYVRETKAGLVDEAGTPAITSILSSMARASN